MQDAKALLDSLMGASRNTDLEEAKKMKGKNFTKNDVCKFYLLGFCPQHELQNSKLVTKRNLGQCNKIHSDAMKQEFDKHPEKAKYKKEYERLFLPILESQVREADSWVQKERANAQKKYEDDSTETKGKATISTMPAEVKEQVAQLTDDMNKMMASAEELAEKGDVGGSKFKVTLAEEIKEKIKELEDAHPSYTVTLKEEWVCDICGTRTEPVCDKNSEDRFACHFTGKVHLGYAKIREWATGIRKSQREGDGDKGRDRGDGDRDKEKEKEKEKEKGQEERRDRGGGRDRRDRDGRDREDRDRRERDRDRSRSKDRRGDRDRERRR